MTSPRIAFSWAGLPQYAARQLRYLSDSGIEIDTIIATRPTVPVGGIEEALGREVTWIEQDDEVKWVELGQSAPSVFFQSGWAVKPFVSLGKQVRSSGGFVVGMSDANWRNDFRQKFLGKAAFLLFLRKHFDAVMVPGHSGAKLMRSYGFEENAIYQGMYGAATKLFDNSRPLTARAKRILFVGQLIQRKNIIPFIEEFMSSELPANGWCLRICGSGELRDSIPDSPIIEKFDFVQPESLFEHYAESRVLVLPSIIEAWGLVVHEAAISGCALLLSENVGSCQDLSSPSNAIYFRPRSSSSMKEALHELSMKDEQWFAKAEQESRSLSKAFGPERFAREVHSILRDLYESSK